MSTQLCVCTGVCLPVCLSLLQLLLEAVNGMYADGTPPGESEVCRRVREAYQHRGLQVPPYLERRIIMVHIQTYD